MTGIKTLQREKAGITSLKKALADITSLQREKADMTSLKKAVADITTQQGKKQAHIVQESSAMQNSLDKIQERVFVQNRTMCVGIVLLSVVTVVALAIALLAIVVTMQSDQYSMNGRMSEDQTDFCTSDSCMVEKRSGYVDKEGREDWLNKLEIRMEQEQRQRRNELDSRMEQEQKERRNELDSRMEQEQRQRRNELDSRMEQEQKERHDELNKTLEDIMLQLSEYDRQTAEGHISRLQKRQNVILTHLKLIPWPHEDILPFEFEMKDFETHKKDGDLWYSPPFYTDINGYKMCIRVKAKGKARKYVSVSVFLMAGVADDYLKWPFREDIKIELINQASSSYGRRNHVQSTVLKSIQRVTTVEMSKVGLRIVRFISHNKLKFNGTHYLKNDKLKFRVSVAPNVRTP